MHAAIQKLLKLAFVTALAVIVNVFANPQHAAANASNSMSVDADFVVEHTALLNVTPAQEKTNVDCDWHKRPCPCQDCKHATKKSNTQLRKTKWLHALKAQSTIWDPVIDIPVNIAISAAGRTASGSPHTWDRRDSPYKIFYATTMRMLT